ncbi:MAG: ferredoxin family protein [Prevotella sp.]|nr:ferredoxin family protein [Prevotella sp.]
MVRKFLKNIDKLPSVLINGHQCKACWQCLGACPSKVLGKVHFLWHKHAKIAHPDKCTGCMTCLKTCPHNAILSIKPFKKAYEEVKKG